MDENNTIESLTAELKALQKKNENVITIENVGRIKDIKNKIDILEKRNVDIQNKDAVSCVKKNKNGGK
jgi:UDP-N-acetylglucosamine enolpyruvyl transferase